MKDIGIGSGSVNSGMRGEAVPTELIDDTVARRAFVAKWIARNRRRAAAGLGGIVLVLPLLAAAQAQDFVEAAGIDGVADVVVGPDGSATITLTNGQTVLVPAGSVQVVGDQVLISAAAAELIAEAAAIGAAASAAAVAGAVAAGAATAIGASGRADGEAAGEPPADAPPSPQPEVPAEPAVPSILPGEIGAGGVLNLSAAQSPVTIEGTTQNVPAGSIGVISLFDADGNLVAGTVQEFTIGDDGRFTTQLPALAELPDGPIADGVYRVLFQVVDADGEEIARSEPELTVDLTPPEVQIDAPAPNELVNIPVRDEQGLTVSGTTDAEDGQTVTVTLAGPGGFEAVATAAVAGGAWSVTFAPADLAGIPDDADIAITAEVSDRAGNSSETSSAVRTDLTAPTIEIAPLTGDNILTLVNQGREVEVTGTTDAQPGNLVQVVFNGVRLDPVPVVAGEPANTWVAIIPAQLTGGDALEDGQSVTLSAEVSNDAGNPSGPVAVSIDIDFSAPSITFDPVAGDNVLNAANRDDDDGVPVTGQAAGLEGRDLEVTLDGVVVATPQVGEDGTFAFVLARDAIRDLDDGTYTLSASGTDADGIDAVPTPLDIRVDYTPPTVTIDAPAFGEFLNGLDAAESQTLRGNVEGNDGLPVTVVLTDASGETFTVDGIPDADGPGWTATLMPELLAALAEGSVEAAAIASDAAGNSSGPVTAEFVKDTVAPQVPDVAPVAGNDILSLANQGRDVEVTGTTDAEPGSAVEVTFNGVLLDPAAVISGDPANTWTAIIPGSLTGADTLVTGELYALSVVAIDRAGNRSPEALVELGVDFDGPSITIDPISETGLINALDAGDPVVISGSTVNADPGSPVRVVIADPDGDTVTLDTETGPDGTWQVELAAPAESGQTFLVTAVVTATIDGEVIESAPAEASYTSDYDPPEFGAIAVTVGGVALIDGGFLNQLQAETEALVVTGSVTGNDGQDLTVAINGVERVVQPENGSFTAEFAAGTLIGPDGLAEGEARATVTTRDAAGNPAEAQSGAFTVDFTPPEITLQDVLLGTDSVLGGFINAADAASQVVTVRFLVSGSDGMPEVRIGNVAADSVTGNGGSFDATFDAGALSGLEDGAYAAVVTATDAAGNSATATTDAFTVDLTPPDLTIDAAEVTVINLALAEAGGEITGTVAGNNGQPVFVQLPIPGLDPLEATVSDGDWSLELTPALIGQLPEGDDVRIEVFTSDAAGNETQTVSEPFLVDLTEPEVAILTVGEDGLAVPGQAVLVTGTTTGTEVEVRFRDGDPIMADIAADGSWTAEIPADQIEGLRGGLELDVVALARSIGNNTNEDTGGVVTYEPAWTFLRNDAPFPGGANELFMVYFLDPTFEPDDRLFFMDIDVEFLSDNVTYPAAGFGGTLPQPTFYQSPFFQFPPSPQEIQAQDISFLGVWLAGRDSDDEVIVDADGNVAFPAISDTAGRLLGFNLVVNDPDQVVEVLTSANVGRGEDPEDLPEEADGESDIFGGPHWTAIGTAGDDVITAPNVDALIRGRGGNDTIDVSAGGVNTIMFEPTQALNGTDEIIGFSLGAATALPDRIMIADLPSQTNLRGTEFEIMSSDTLGPLGANTGFLVFTTNLGGDQQSESDVIDALGLGANEVLYVLATGGDDASLSRLVMDGDGNPPADLDDVEELASFLDLGDLSGFTADNIFGFTLATT